MCHPGGFVMCGAVANSGSASARVLHAALHEKCRRDKAPEVPYAPACPHRSCCALLEQAKSTRFGSVPAHYQGDPPPRKSAGVAEQSG